MAGKKYTGSITPVASTNRLKIE